MEFVKEKPKPDYERGFAEGKAEGRRLEREEIYNSQRTRFRVVAAAITKLGRALYEVDEEKYRNMFDPMERMFFNDFIKKYSSRFSNDYYD